MKIGINLKIDVTKIDKDKMFQGQKGTYLDATVFVDTDNQDQYGNNGMITQALPKEEREAGNKGAILGNCKVFWSRSSDNRNNNSGSQAQRNEPQQSNPDDGFNDIPFNNPYKSIWRMV